MSHKLSKGRGFWSTGFELRAGPKHMRLLAGPLLQQYWAQGTVLPSGLHTARLGTRAVSVVGPFCVLGTQITQSCCETCYRGSCKQVHRSLHHHRASSCWAHGPWLVIMHSARAALWWSAVWATPWLKSEAWILFLVLLLTSQLKMNEFSGPQLDCIKGIKMLWFNGCLGFWSLRLKTF